MDILKRQNVSSLAHNFGISPEVYMKSDALRESFEVISTMKDLKGTEYVAWVEGKAAPVFATQFHPEKNSFEFGRTTIPHGNDGVYAMSDLSQFLISVAKKNGNVFPPDELEKRQMFNYPPVRTHYIFTTVSLFE